MRTSVTVATLTGVLVALLAPSSGLWGQTNVQPPATRGTSPDRTPDISGVWARNLGGGAEIPGRPPGPDFLSNSRKPEPAMTPSALKQYEANKAASGYQDPVFNCFPPGVPRIYAVDFNGVMELVQIPGRVLQVFEFDHHIRQIYTDGRKHDDAQAATWMGDSIGRWEGDTLVVETVNFNDQTRLDRLGHPHSDALHLVERFRRVNKDLLTIDITITDPKAYLKPWGGQLYYAFRPDWKVTEFMCKDNQTFDDFRAQTEKK